MTEMKKKVAFIIAQERFQDPELDMPKTALDKSGVITMVASNTTETAMGVFGTSLQPDSSIEDLDSLTLDGVVIIGGHGAVDYLYNDMPLRLLIQNMNNQGKLVASICSAGAVLANAGILKDRKATAYDMEEVQEAFMQAGVELLADEPVVVDGNIITANGPEAAGRFTLALLEALNIKSVRMGLTR
jgi:protease I